VARVPGRFSGSTFRETGLPAMIQEAVANSHSFSYSKQCRAEARCGPRESGLGVRRIEARE
jgi:hypothetical protein